ncbi:MAG: PAS domain-containing protein [Betaproteobacteria bacterium]|nr:PAS domain-containing protein [Betaproteobacteria bacterium]NCP80837.1 PAS domain-containing protein [Rhodoferax sp.]NCS60964.1 PAS domain-containing protein [Rhodoferax sp.]PIZ21449.1 MAG: PAS domain-containing sensor histidine kinase [Comamonadaceae bacterium CG_4_10_14_0_8_um_filter_57_29]PJC14687.1 MAG: PAS domain-containing sensor histidine kinase [Comamonadaceae bacterium CG_4_9_14_0_8_um_filter_57_21]
MTPSSKVFGWFDSGLLHPRQDLAPYPQEFERLWRAFMTARVSLGLMLVGLQGGLFLWVPQQSVLPLLIVLVYWGAALAVRLLTKPRAFGHTFDPQWISTVGIDLLVFAALQAGHNSSINYSPLFALPVLMASILGSLLMAMGTSAVVTLLLFGYASWVSIQTPWDTTTQFVQAALTGAGCFVIAVLASQLASRLASVELRAQRSHGAAASQRQVNELVIESLSDGVVVVDAHFQVRCVNPAALTMLGLSTKPDTDAPWLLTQQPAWRDLLEVVRQSHATQSQQQRDLSIQNTGQGPRHLRVHTQLTQSLEVEALPLCVVFMQDQREMQARLRTEKLASMGRMSAAVAHEIRNPLAAIVQANALLAEDLPEPSQLRLTQMVQQNAQRLEKIVHDVLHLAQVSGQDGTMTGAVLDLKESVVRVSRDWQQQVAAVDYLTLNLPDGDCEVWFDTEHLRRIVVNLLDNARRFASGQPGSIQVSVSLPGATWGQAAVGLHVWSDGGPLDPSVEQHLFEPFFSSDSRSSGLGLYICRELCQSHGAHMSYDRTFRQMNQVQQSGNEFSVMFGMDTPVASPARLQADKAT